MRVRGVIGWVWRLPIAAILALACSSDARAYTVESVATEGCHERITSEALRRVREEIEAAAPIATDSDERALIDDLQFTPDEDMRDLGAVALLLGVRSNDLKGRGADDLTSLALVHGDPETQDEHCLRDPDHDEPGGTRRSLEACRAFIEGNVRRAIESLDDAGRPTSRTLLPIHLAIRGSVEASLPAFYVHIGQALHALEDGFSHTYRTEDGRRVTVALSWLEVVDGTHTDSRDGPPHSAALDACDDADELRTLRRELATDAATEVLRAAFAPGDSTDQKMGDVRALLDVWLGYQPGCTAENGWCDAPEAFLPAPGCGCEATGLDASSGGAALAAAAGAMAIARRRGRRSPRGSRAGRLLGLVLLAGASSPALAQPGPEPPPTAPTPPPPPAATPADATVTTTVIPGSSPDSPPTTATQVTTPSTVTTIVTTPVTTDPDALPPPTIVPVAEPGPPEPNAIAWGAAVTAAGAVDKPALAFALGGRLRVHASWAFGLDAEWNPWLSLTGGEVVRTGALNVYGTAFWRVPLTYEAFNVRSSVSVGTSVLLTELYGAPSGSVGLFLGANFLGVEYKASKAFYVVINPLGIAVPVPQLSGLPFLYPQYRFSLALELYGG